MEQKDAHFQQNKLMGILNESLDSGKIIIDDNMVTWGKITELLLQVSSKIIALRGAGTWNGMDQEEVDQLLTLKLIPIIENASEHEGIVTILFDGDSDNPSKPDIGYIAGRLLQHFGNIDNKVIFIAAQKQGWYPKELNGENIKNAGGLQYITYIFPDKTYPGEHNSFTQSEQFANSEKYEQWYIGASGQIANEQLSDYNNKISGEKKGKVSLFRIRNNGVLDKELEQKIEAAKVDVNEKLISTLQSRIDQRKDVYGVHWDNDGNPNINPSDYPNLELTFVS